MTRIPGDANKVWPQWCEKEVLTVSAAAVSKGMLLMFAVTADGVTVKPCDADESRLCAGYATRDAAVGETVEFIVKGYVDYAYLYDGAAIGDALATGDTKAGWPIEDDLADEAAVAGLIGVVLEAEDGSFTTDGGVGKVWLY